MNLSIASYAAAALAYGLMTGLLALSRPPSSQGRWLLVAVGGTGVWGVVLAVALARSNGELTAVTYSADALRTLAWTLCLLAALRAEPGRQQSKRLLAIGAVVLAAIVVLFAAPFRDPKISHLALLASAVLGCLTVEQLFRNSTAEQKEVLKPFLWTIAAIFGYELFVFSNAVLLGEIDHGIWAIRGVLAALAAPVLLVAAKRHPDWAETLFISRKVVFYSTTLTGVGLYLIAMALVGGLIKEQGGQWGWLAQLLFLAAALIVLALVLSSARIRALVRVFITKHFYRNQYEYRDEWLELIRTLSESGSDLALEQRGIKALADIIDAPGGQLWLAKDATSRFEPFAAWRAPFPAEELEQTSGLVRFLKDQGWVIDSEEYERDPERYNHAFRESSAGLLQQSIIVPLFHQDELLGLARVVRPEGHRALNYEDHDLLKTAGRQVAAFLAHDLAQEQLTETRQFEAYNKLSAFVMHDLKNLLSQQTLLVENAKKHQHRPEFVADVIKTVDSGVQRMRKLLRQLEQRSAFSREQRIELSQLVGDTVSNCSRNGGTRATFSRTRPFWVQAQPDRLESVIAHVIVNAQEATRCGGTIDVAVSERDGRALIEVCDSGEGMSEEFMRRRLFKPFDTTKGSSGMGIGIYQTREIIRALGGDIVVESELGKGTIVRLTLPLADPVSETVRRISL
jgi:putative PEP-CTERM system histidine kinase